MKGLKPKTTLFLLIGIPSALIAIDFMENN